MRLNVSVSLHRRQLPRIKTESVHGVRVYVCVCVFCPLQPKKKYICVTIYLTKCLFIICFKTNIYWNIRWAHWGHVIVILGYVNKMDLIHMVIALNRRLLKK